MTLNDYPKYVEFMQKSSEEKKTLLLINDPQALAYTWIEAYAQNLSDQATSYGSGWNEPEHHDGVSVDELIDTGLSQLDTDSPWGGDCISRGGAFEGVDVDPVFWDKLAILMGIEIPHDKRYSFFSCSC